ncbi:uncharacterized protein LOC129695819 isoform X2 [Leucoraja erinacea]|uniref:uncharacterized protein LOC129695819 isoform X2 n=1 Tax=Leucoraja erinaceus TaxID=7782 RepID=UPI002456513C|nr:uncharacterized protein LOC129695819 isoform X2 [Leucoraja erinacea]
MPAGCPDARRRRCCSLRRPLACGCRAPPARALTHQDARPRAQGSRLPVAARPPARCSLTRPLACMLPRAARHNTDPGTGLAGCSRRQLACGRWLPRAAPRTTDPGTRAQGSRFRPLVQREVSRVAEHHFNGTAVKPSEDTQQQIIRETFHLVSKRDENVCNFLEGGMLIGGADNKLIYRHYATLYFVFCVDSSESELGILDLIQVFVETLDKCFENVCELDLIFHVDKVHNILAEMVMGGMVLETNMNEIVTQIDAQNKMEKSETFIFQSPRQDR